MNMNNDSMFMMITKFQIDLTTDTKHSLDNIISNKCNEKLQQNIHFYYIRLMTCVTL